MDISRDNSETVEELQIIEHNLQNILAQKQMFQVDMQEIENALSELAKTKDEVYKVLSGIMMKAEKNELIKELEEKNKLLELRISSIEKQEKILGERGIKLRHTIKGSMEKDKR